MYSITFGYNREKVYAIYGRIVFRCYRIIHILLRSPSLVVTSSFFVLTVELTDRNNFAGEVYKMRILISIYLISCSTFALIRLDGGIMLKQAVRRAVRIC